MKINNVNYYNNNGLSKFVFDILCDEINNFILNEKIGVVSEYNEYTGRFVDFLPESITNIEYSEFGVLFVVKRKDGVEINTSLPSSLIRDLETVF